MNKFTNCVNTVLLVLMVTVSLQAQVHIVGHISAEVVSPLEATETAQLNFGRFSPEKAGGQIILTPKGVASSTGTVSVISGTHNPGSFSICGVPEAIISVQLPEGPTTLTNSANSGTMIVSNWSSEPPQKDNMTISANGAREFNIGATLEVGNIHDNPVGMYSGTYHITFNYN